MEDTGSISINRKTSEEIIDELENFNVYYLYLHKIQKIDYDYIIDSIFFENENIDRINFKLGMLCGRIIEKNENEINNEIILEFSEKIEKIKLGCRNIQELYDGCFSQNEEITKELEKINKLFR
jgi:hypothetical protein